MIRAFEPFRAHTNLLLSLSPSSFSLSLSLLFLFLSLYPSLREIFYILLNFTFHRLGFFRFLFNIVAFAPLHSTVTLIYFIDRNLIPRRTIPISLPDNSAKSDTSKLAFNKCCGRNGQSAALILNSIQNMLSSSVQLLRWLMLSTS